MFLLVKLVFGLISAYLVYGAISRRCNKYLAFAVVALWLRFFLSAFHDITYEPLIAGFSINALSSIGIAGMGLLLLPRNFLTLQKLGLIYLFFASIILSGVLNGAVVGLINVMVKWMFFLTVTGAIFMAVRKVGKDEVLRKLLVAFFLPVSLQIMSILLGEAKATEADGSTSYIGGYNHEAAFSMIIASFTLVVGLISAGYIRFRTFLFGLGCILLVIANYRTSVLAILPLAAIFAFNSMEARIAPRYKAVFLIAAFFGMGLAFLLLSYSMQDRFADVFVFLGSLDELMKAPMYYSEAEKDIFSARVYIWSQYIYTYWQGDWIHQLVGWGPESWSGRFPKYAHNTYVSFLFEYGAFGLLCFLLAVTGFLKQSLRIKNRRYSLMLCSSMVGFLIMCFATMPLWNIEGLILYAILIGNTLAPVRLLSADETHVPAFLSRFVRV
ncbi:O-antigen ligase family protein [Salinimonas iocasae]|uniref:O-antigen ligase domain-containing protein n=1 Tax=Salinimonas iocasae TaxID=2572577 RepID=A0A5B7YGG0_9ALTE|nr:O-antigen ligase family protein [Salinimonas iocasae]QCZ94450.1 O-antigen ligase domain-containing protein [Salinimonas iocasae]